ncbi:peptidase S9 [Fervidobacterium sp. SC_NGM5_O18]|nr:S9 family peptidase [Fervidobacterium pennivorans]MDM7320204.1 S9 family peptidase [Fervidobacterium sp.]PHJ13402.1 peptidase S9 [Fervidobacterium sp. SC_NGM5_O18]
MAKITLEDLLNFKFISSLEVSPDGRKLAFVVHEMNKDDNLYNSNIWLYDTVAGSLSQLTSSNRDSSPIWLDDSRLLFISWRDEKDRKRKENGEPLTPFYEIDVEGGEARKLFELPLYVERIKKLNDNTFLFIAEYDYRLGEFWKLSVEEKEKVLKALKEEKDYEVLDEIPFWANGVGFTNKKRSRLFRYNIQTQEIIPITDEFSNVEYISDSPDGKTVLYIANFFKDVMKMPNDLFLYDVEKNETTKLTHHDHFMYTLAELVDGKVVFAGSDMKRYGINENPKFYVLDISSQQVKLITPNFDLDIDNSVNSDCRYGGNRIVKVDGKYLYFVSTQWHDAQLFRLDISGNVEQLTFETGSVDGFDVSNGKIFFVGLRNMKLQEIYELVGRQEKQLSQFNEWVQKERYISRPERFTFNTKDGTTLEGWVMKPFNFEPGKKFPTILEIHGGPKTAYGEVFMHEMQLLASEGYVVIYCNPRGSDGRGNEFADIRGKYGTIDYEDIMQFVDEAIRRYDFIDENKIGVTGGSYGGFMTNWIIGHTDRFKAAVSQRSIANWISKFGTTDIGYFFVEDQQLATPWNDYEKLWWHSPMKYADKVKTPTLFIHSDEDYRCWLVEAIQMFTSLKYHGVESKLVIFKGENHDLSRTGKPLHRLRRLKEIVEWFDKYLKANE